MYTLKTHNYECADRQHGERRGRLNMDVAAQNGERTDRDVAHCLRSCIQQPMLLCFRWTWPPSRCWKVSTPVWITVGRCSCRSWGEPFTSSMSAPASLPARIHWTRVVAARVFRVPSSTDSPRFACLFVFCILKRDWCFSFRTSCVLVLPGCANNCTICWDLATMGHCGEGSVMLWWMAFLEYDLNVSVLRPGV